MAVRQLIVRCVGLAVVFSGCTAVRVMGHCGLGEPDPVCAESVRAGTKFDEVGPGLLGQGRYGGGSGRCRIRSRETTVNWPSNVMSERSSSVTMSSTVSARLAATSLIKTTPGGAPRPRSKSS
jgi:hypothetical protein